MNQLVTLTNGETYKLVFRYHQEMSLVKLKMRRGRPVFDSAGRPIVIRQQIPGYTTIITEALLISTSTNNVIRGLTVRSEDDVHDKEQARHYALLNLSAGLTEEDYARVLAVYEARKPKAEAGNA